MIIVNLDVMMAKRKISSGELSERVGIALWTLSLLLKQATEYKKENDLTI